jgi:hypothetical protein
MEALVSDPHEVAAHDVPQTHRYVVHYPDHFPRSSDPHYVDFEHYHRTHRLDARCYTGERIGFGECKTSTGTTSVIAAGVQTGLELHHAHIEFAVQNGVDLVALEVDYPGVSNPDEVGAWVESGANFRFLCSFHHRMSAGAHTASHSDWEGEQYIRGLIS